MFCYLVMVNDLACSHTDVGRLLGLTCPPRNARRQGLKFGLCGRQQLFALAAPLLGQVKVIAGHQPFTRKCGELISARRLVSKSCLIRWPWAKSRRIARFRRAEIQFHPGCSLGTSIWVVVDVFHDRRRAPPTTARPLRPRLDLVGDGLRIAGVPGIARTAISRPSASVNAGRGR